MTSILELIKFPKPGAEGSAITTQEGTTVKKRMAFKQEDISTFFVETDEGTEILQSTRDSINKLISEIRAGKEVGVVAGAFGDMEMCDGIVESTETPPEGGLLTKFYGSPFLFKGFPERWITEGIGLAKAMVSQIPRKILGTSWYWKIVFATRFFFSRKRFWHDVHIYIMTMWGHTILKLDVPRERYNAVAREIMRATDEACKKLLDRMGDKNDLPYSHAYFPLLLQRTPDVMSKREFLEVVAKIAQFVAFFIEYDNAYRFRIQDIFKELDKEVLKKDAIKEIDRLLKLLIEREDEEKGQKYKWIEIRRILMPFLRVSKEARNFVREFLLALDQKAVDFDEHDWYLCLRRMTYEFKGIPLIERLKEVDRIDNERQIQRFMRIERVIENVVTPGVKVLAVGSSLEMYKASNNVVIGSCFLLDD